MKYRDTLGRPFTPGVIGDVPTGNVVWVDAVHGNDDLAVRERLTVPFKTLGAAKSAAQSGDTILVMPGTYNEKNLLKNQVNWHFLNGAKVIYDGTSDGAIFDTSNLGSNGAVQSSVTGAGYFENQATQSNSYALHSFASGSFLDVQCHSLKAYKDAVKMSDVSGSGRIQVFDLIQSSIGSALWVTGGGSTPKFRVNAARVYGTGYRTVQVSAGNLHLDTDLIKAGSDPAIYVSGGSGTIAIRAYEVESGATETVYFSAYYSVTLSLLQARIQNYNTSSSARAIKIATGGAYNVKLVGCTLIVDSSANYSMEASSSTPVQFHGDSVANEPSTNVTAIGGSLVVDSNIS